LRDKTIKAAITGKPQLEPACLSKKQLHLLFITDLDSDLGGSR
jgi:hypothetical protein